jgi:hypothetical protein
VFGDTGQEGLECKGKSEMKTVKEKLGHDDQLRSEKGSLDLT